MAQDSASTRRDAVMAFLETTQERVAVLLPLPLQGTYDYLVGAAVAERGLEPGAIVEVPLGSRGSRGVVWDNAALRASPAGETLAASRLKAVTRRYDIPPMTRVARRFVANIFLSRRLRV